MIIYESATIKWIFKETVCDDVNWIYVAEERNQWRTLANMVMNIRVKKNKTCGIILTTRGTKSV
jgi:hypothetical protein